MESKDSTMASTMCFLLKKANNHFQWWICLWQRCPCCMSTAPINRSNGPPCACLPSNSIQATSCWTFFFQLRNRRFFLTNCLGRAFFHGIPWEVLIPPYSTPPGIATVRYLKKKNHVWESSTKRDPVSKIYLVMLWIQWIQSCSYERDMHQLHHL